MLLIEIVVEYYCKITSCKAKVVQRQFTDEVDKVVTFTGVGSNQLYLRQR